MVRHRSDPFLRERPRRGRAVLTVLAIAVGGVGLWFGAVDFSWFVERCEDCRRTREVFQYRVFGWPFYSWDRCTETFLQVAAADLDVPCLHQSSFRWHKHRYWGLCVCARPCINGIFLMTGGEENWPVLLDELRQRADEEPSLREELHQRVLVEHDIDYYRALLDDLYCRMRGVDAEPQIEDSLPSESG